MCVILSEIDWLTTIKVRKVVQAKEIFSPESAGKVKRDVSIIPRNNAKVVRWVNLSKI